MRRLGPLRYEVVGAKVLFSSRTYKAKVSFLADNAVDVHDTTYGLVVDRPGVTLLLPTGGWTMLLLLTVMGLSLYRIRGGDKKTRRRAM